jgi:adenylate kinase
MASGALVPDETVVAIMAKAVAECDAAAGLMLDGFPRTVAQAEALDNTLEQRNTPLDAVVLITAEEGAIVERITGRRSCPQCGKGFHVKFMPSRRGGVCDVCEGEVALTQREDDREETVRARLAAYRTQTEPVVSYYRGRGRVRVIEIDGMGTPDAVTEAMVQALEALGG